MKQDWNWLGDNERPKARRPPENFLWFYLLKFFSLCLLHWLVFPMDSGPKTSGVRFGRKHNFCRLCDLTFCCGANSRSLRIIILPYPESKYLRNFYEHFIWRVEYIKETKSLDRCFSSKKKKSLDTAMKMFKLGCLVMYRARKYGLYVVWWNLFLHAKQQQEQISPYFWALYISSKWIPFQIKILYFIL